MGSVGDTRVCCLCRRWSPRGVRRFYDSLDYVPMVCGRCRQCFEDSGLPSWQDRYLLQPLQMLGFCNKLPVGQCREAWILILEFVVRAPFCEVADMPCGVPYFLWYDDMVCHSYGPQDIFERFRQIPEVPVVEKIVFVPKPLGTCRVPLQLHQSRSAPALLCSIWRLRPPKGSPEKLRELPNCPPEPLLIRPSGPLAGQQSFLSGWPWAGRASRTPSGSCAAK